MVLEVDVTTIDITELAQSLLEGLDRIRRSGRWKKVQDADERQPPRPLRARREGERCCAAEQRYERAPVHVWMAPDWQEITSRAAQKSLAVMCPACSRSPDGLVALMGSANRGLIIRAGSMSR